MRVVVVTRVTMGVVSVVGGAMVVVVRHEARIVCIEVVVVRIIIGAPLVVPIMLIVPTMRIIVTGMGIHMTGAMWVHMASRVRGGCRVTPARHRPWCRCGRRCA